MGATDNMNTYPMQDILKYCKTCETLLAAIEKCEANNGELGQPDLGELRVKCAYCRTIGQNGIYKADAILGAYKADKQNRAHGNGRACVLTERQIGAIREQKRQGLSCAEIARRTGLSPATVCRHTKGVVKGTEKAPHVI